MTIVYNHFTIVIVLFEIRLFLQFGWISDVSVLADLLGLLEFGVCFMQKIPTFSIQEVTFLDECMTCFSFLYCVVVWVISELVCSMGKLAPLSIWAHPFLLIIYAETTFHFDISKTFSVVMFKLPVGKSYCYADYKYK